MDDVEFLWIDPAGVSVMSLGYRGGWVVVALAQNLRHESGDRDDSIGVGEKMVSAQRGAGALG